MINQAETEDGSPQDNESQLDPMMKEDDEEGLEGAAEESPDQSISSGMPTDSGLGEGNAPIVQDGKFFGCLDKVTM